MELPDLNSMTDDQVSEWFATNDTSGLTGTGRPVEGQFIQVDETGTPVGRMVSLKGASPHKDERSEIRQWGVSGEAPTDLILKYGQATVHRKPTRPGPVRDNRAAQHRRRPPRPRRISGRAVPQHAGQEAGTGCTCSPIPKPASC